MLTAVELQPCIDECQQCHTTCVQALQHCLEMDHPNAEHVRLHMDCAQICTTSADFMLRGSPLHVHTCRACSEVCLRCAAACDEMSDDAVMRNCAEVCHRCADACRQMAQMGS